MPVHRHQELTRDQRNEVLTLRLIGFKYKVIQEFFREKRGIEVTCRQIQKAIEAGRPIPQKKGHVGRTRLLSEEEVDELELFII